MTLSETRYDVTMHPILVLVGAVGALAFLNSTPGDTPDARLRPVGIPRGKFPHLKQRDSSGCGATSVAMCARYYEFDTASEFTELHLSGERQGFKAAVIEKQFASFRRMAFDDFQFAPLTRRGHSAVLALLPLALHRGEPVVLCLAQGKIQHAVVAYGGLVDEAGQLREVFLADPAEVSPWGNRLSIAKLTPLLVEAVFTFDPRRA